MTMNAPLDWLPDADGPMLLSLSQINDLLACTPIPRCRSSTPYGRHLATAKPWPGSLSST
jgi:hypothetical protein